MLLPIRGGPPGSGMASSCCSVSRTGRCGMRADRRRTAELDRALALHGRGPYVVQAASPRCTRAERDCSIVALYDELARLTDSAVVELNRAPPCQRRYGPRRGWRSSSGCRCRTTGTLHSTRAENAQALGASPSAGRLRRRWRSFTTTRAAPVRAAAGRARHAADPSRRRVILRSINESERPMKRLCTSVTAMTAGPVHPCDAFRGAARRRNRVRQGDLRPRRPIRFCARALAIELQAPPGTRSCPR